MKIIIRTPRGGLEALIHDYDLTYDNIVKYNDIQPSQIMPGMLITVELEDDIEYRVKPFDTIDRIAAKYGVTPKYIKEYNNIDRVFLGDIVLIEKSKARRQ